MPSPSELSATVSGGPYNGEPIYTWAQDVFLSEVTSKIVASAVGATVGIWEFCVFFPAEIVLWRRIVKNGRPGRTSFAPWTTLALRYLVLCFAVSNSFVAWSTTMPSVASCKVSSGFLIASGDVLNAGIAFAIAWRAQAVARGVIQSRNKIRLMQFFIALLVIAQTFIIIFSATWPSIRDTYWRPYLQSGRCLALHPAFYSSSFSGSSYAEDPILWFYVVTIIFNLVCLIVVLTALRSLATRSRGFSKFINGMRNHSLFFFIIVLLLSTLAIIWRGVQRIEFFYQPITVIEAAVMIRILLAEQDAARRPLDTTFIDNTYAASRQPDNRGGANGQGPTTTQQQNNTNIRADTTVQFADRLQNQDFLQYQQHLHQQQQLDLLIQQQHFVPRPIYQPFSIMDNLGQAFSQVDSQNPQELDDQSLNLSNSSSSSSHQEPNEYPGVAQQEMEEQREKQERQVELFSKHQTEGLQQSVDTSIQNNSKEAECKRKAPLVAIPPTRRQRPVSLHSASERNYLRSSNVNAADDDDDDDDEEVGIQTSQF